MVLLLLLFITLLVQLKKTKEWDEKKMCRKESLSNVKWCDSMMRKRGECETTDELQDLLPSRWSPFASVAALKRIDERFGDRLAPERRGELRIAIADLERRYFGPMKNSGESDLEELVRAWVREAAPGR